MSDQQLWDSYFSWFHDSQVWKKMQYHGIRTLKLPSDLWNYQEIIFERGIDYVVETGTRHGGSALFFSHTLKARNASGFVITVDVDPQANQVGRHDGIHFLIGDSGAAAMAEKIAGMLPPDRGPLFMILDSDHTRDHVYRELTVLMPLLRSGDYLIVEDTSVNGHPVRPTFGPGPWEAIMDYCRENPGVLQADLKRERKFGATGAPDGYYVKV